MNRISLLFTLLLITQSFAFAQEKAEDEWIKVYFNMPADHSVAMDGNIAMGESDLIGSLESLIDAATTSIDLCIYDLEHPRIVNALVRAKKRGLRIRLVTDNYNRTDGNELDAWVWETLASADITSIDDDGDVYSASGIEDHKLVNAGADMHHKFAVIDAESKDKSDDYVWTGSTNLTYTGAYNTNHTIVIKDTDIAKAYKVEFEQMWGSNNEIPNPEKARFHKDKKVKKTQTFDVGGTEVELYFAPVDREKKKPSISDRIVSLIFTEAQSDVNFQAFAITPTIPISEAMWQHSDIPSIQLRGVIDKSFYSRYEKAGDTWGSEASKKDNRLVLPSNELRKLHHKILILDANNTSPSDVGVVVTGSYNFSNNAEFNNDENLLIIYSDDIANQFYQDFSGTLKRAKGEMEPPVPPVDAQKLYEVTAISDGSRFDIEVAPGFGYPVRLLGVNVPSIYAGTDSSEYFSAVTAEYVSNLLEGKRVRVYSPRNEAPISRYGVFRAYVDIEIDGQMTPLNHLLLKEGYGRFEDFYAQHPDSVAAFKAYEALARTNKKGMWRSPAKVGTKVSRKKELSSGVAAEMVYPININTADQSTLELLPGIGPSYAKRIIEYRIQNGGFSDISELTKVKGIGEKRFEKIRAFVTI